MGSTLGEECILDVDNDAGTAASPKREEGCGSVEALAIDAFLTGGGTGM
jgi:hypothetical protein